MTLKIIKDPVHGYIEVEDFARGIMDAPALQRLRYIRQLGFSFLVYPGANHTRFEHSLGTMYLADVACRRFQLADDERQLVVAAALLHDIGHGPFSHASEPLMEKYLHRTHDDLGPILGETVGGLLSAQGIDPAELSAVVNGTHRLSSIIHGDFDVDRMDYLLRDAYYTGALYGTVDAQRLIRHLIWTAEGTVLDENGVNAAESLLIARTLMRPTVYYHHVSRIGESMFQLAALEHLHDIGGRDAEQFLRLDDSGCMHVLAHSGSAVSRDIMSRLYERRLYKRALLSAANRSRSLHTRTASRWRRAASMQAVSQRSPVSGPMRCWWTSPPCPTRCCLPSGSGTGIPRPVSRRSPPVSVPSTRPGVSSGVSACIPCRRSGSRWRMQACEVLHIRKPTRQDTLF